jgi:4-diphosphocytidyl-2-C-methyl-D-erythritol kinase
MIVFPNAKLNLGLKVLKKRSDGFHDIQTVLFPIPLRDLLEAIPSPDGAFHFACSGNVTTGMIEDNLCVRAVRVLQNDFDIPPVHLYLHKVIPSGAGLGGGSSDAACTLILLNTLFELGLDKQRLMQYASRLGSDCAFFISNVPSLAEGRGEKVSDLPLDLKGYYLAVVKPELSVSTAAAYSWVEPDDRPCDISDIILRGIPAWKDALINDFEVAVFEQYPELEIIKRKLYDAGAVYSSMSGSGSAIFGIFPSGPQKPALSFPACFFWDAYL